MNKTLFLSTVVLASSLLMSNAYSAPAAEKKTAMIGKIAEMSGDVEIMKRGTGVWVTATPGMTVATGDQVNTSIDGKAVIEFANSKTQVKPLTQFTVGRAMEGKDAFYTEIFLQAGGLSSAVDKQSGKQNKFTVTTPSAVCGVRGTVQEVGFEEGFGTETHIEDGEGYLAPVDVEKMPEAVQALLGIAPPPQEALPAAGGAPGAEGAAPGGELGAATPGAAAGEAGAPAPEAAGAAEAAAFDAYLNVAFDAQVEGVEKTAEAPSGEAPEQPAAPGEEAAAAPAEGVAAPAEAAPMGEENLGEVITVGEGQDAAIEIGGEVSTPDEIVADDAKTDVLPASATEAEQEAASVSTDVVDEPAGIAAQDQQEEVAQEQKDEEEQKLEETAFIEDSDIIYPPD